MSGRRTSVTPGALYSEPRVSRRRRRCDGHLADLHWIEVGDTYVTSSLPPSHELADGTWWHLRMCLDCTPKTGGAS